LPINSGKFLIGQFPIAVAMALCFVGGLHSLFQFRWFDMLLCFLGLYLSLELGLRWMLHCLGITREQWSEVSD
jgi:hypothetical protein